MIKIKSTNMLEVKCSSPQEFNFIVAFAEKKLKFIHPQVKSSMRTGRYVPKGINYYIRGYTSDKENSIIILPRGFWNRLEEYLDDEEIEYIYKERHVTNRLFKRFRYVNGVQLRPYQRDAVRAALDTGEGIIDAPCGSGKTEILTSIIRHLNQQTLILVHTDDLMTQMKERIERAFGIEVGIIRQKRMDIKPITIASVMTLKNRELDEEFLSHWGVVMLDESHHMPAFSFTEVMSQFPAKYRFGTTATSIRQDGLHGLMFAHIGYRVYKVDYETLYKAGYLMPAEVIRVPTEFEYKMRSKTDYHNLLRALKTNRPRNNIIIRKLLKKKQKNHFNLILSSHIDHLEDLAKMLIKADPILMEKSRLLIGRMNKEQRRQVLDSMRNGEINYIFATQLADEGLDVPNLDRVHLVFPTRAEGKVQQQIGRAQRTHPGKKDALIYDYYDEESPTLRRQAEARMRVFENTGCFTKPKSRRGNRKEPKRFAVTK